MKKLNVAIILVFIAIMSASSLFAAEIPSGSYFIKSVKSGSQWKGVWDVPGTPNSFKNGQNIQVWEMDKKDSRKRDRAFYIRKDFGGYYSIRSGLNLSNAYVNVDGNRTKNGTNIELWSKKRGSNASGQRFRFVHMGQGRFKIYTKSGKILCLDGRSDRNGSNVHLWDNHNGSWCEWYLVKKRTKKIFVPRGSVSSQDDGGSSNSGITLDQAFRASKNSSKLATYFKTVSYSKLRSENSKKSISSRLNKLGEGKCINKMMYLVQNAAKNKNSSARYIVYSEIYKADFKRLKKSFTWKIQLSLVKKVVKKTLKGETRSNNKRALNTIISKM